MGAPPAPPASVYSLWGVSCSLYDDKISQKVLRAVGWWSNKLSTVDECDKWDMLLHLWIKTLHLKYYILDVMFPVSQRGVLLCGGRTSILFLHMENQYWTIAQVNCHCGIGGWRTSTSNQSPGKLLDLLAASIGDGQECACAGNRNREVFTFSVVPYSEQS